MLPGFKILFATVVLSISVLIFGLGAAALLRSAHDDFVSMPSWRLAQQPMFVPSNEASRPTLALLRAEPPAAADKAAKTEPNADTKIDSKTDSKVDLKPSDAKESDTKASETKASGDKTASLDPQATPDAAVDIARPAKPKLRKSKRAQARVATQRRRAIVRTRTPRTVEQQPAQVMPGIFNGT